MRKLLVLVMMALLFSACSSEPPPEPTATAAAQVSVSTSTPTSVPTQPLPTAAPTDTPAPPTATSTRTIKLTATPTTQAYTVRSGDTLLDLAIKFETTTEAIIAANDIAEEDLLQLGQKLIIPTPETDNEAAAPSSRPHNTQDASVATVENNNSGTEEGEIGAGQSSSTAKNEAGGSSGTDGSAPAAPAAPEFKLPLPPAIVRAANINPLTGLVARDPATLRRRPIMVRIGNDQGARAAQLGMNRADIVYEEITEWWVTRFTAIFLSELPDVVAPIRSARLINTLLGPQYQAAVAHSGGSDPVRWQMTQIPIANLDQWFHGGLFFHREGEGWMTRAAFKAGDARDYLDQKGLDANVKLRGFEFSPTINSGELAPNIFIPFPRATSFTQWTYNPASGKYLRYIKDAALIDASDGTQIAASNVIVYFAEHTETEIVEDSNGGKSIQIDINGRGKAWFFRDGKLNTGYWQTDGSQTPYFTLEDGSPYPLKPGNTWIQVVPSYFKIGLNSADEASSRP